MKQPKLTDEELQTHLERVPQWSMVDDAISRQYSFHGFVGSIQFVNQVALAAEAANHHPDIDIRFAKVTLTLTTHDSGGITINDFNLAATCDDLAEQISQ